MGQKLKLSKVSKLVRKGHWANGKRFSSTGLTSLEEKNLKNTQKYYCFSWKWHFQVVLGNFLLTGQDQTLYLWHCIQLKWNLEARWYVPPPSDGMSARMQEGHFSFYGFTTLTTYWNPHCRCPKILTAKLMPSIWKQTWLVLIQVAVKITNVWVFIWRKQLSWAYTIYIIHGSGNLTWKYCT